MVEDIAPPLKCILCIEQALSEGRSLQTGLKQYIALGKSSLSKDDFFHEIQELLQTFLMDKNPASLTSKTIYRNALKDLLWSGLKGQSIYKELQSLKEEIIQAAQADMKAFIDSIPLKSTLPLLCLQFPSFLMLLMGPVLTQILEFL